MAEKSESVNLCVDVVEGSIFNVTQDNLISVSYTHLDVYKRQLLYSSYNIFWCRRIEFILKKVLTYIHVMSCYRNSTV